MQNPRPRVSRLRLLLAALLAGLAAIGGSLSAAGATTIATRAVPSVEALAYSYDAPLYSAPDRDAAAKHGRPALPASASEAVDHSWRGGSARRAATRLQGVVATP